MGVVSTFTTPSRYAPSPLLSFFFFFLFFGFFVCSSGIWIDTSFYSSSEIDGSIFDFLLFESSE
jgi:hypothetical protein